MYITLQEKKKKKKRIKSNMTIGDNLTIFRHHMPLNIKENMIVHLKRRRKIGFGYRVASHAPSKWCKRHLLANIFLAQSRIFSFLKNNKQYENTKISFYNPNNYTKYPNKNIKISSNEKLIFVA